MLPQARQNTSTAPVRRFTCLRAAKLQRKCACGGTPDSSGECEECRKKRLSLQRRSRNSELETRNDSFVPPIVHEVLRSPGQPLDLATRAFMEPRFRHDFSRVRVHADPTAAKSAAALTALAYTFGNDVVFASGQYTPETNEGRHIIAHELTHTIQQGGSHPHADSVISDPRDPSENEAQLAADAILKVPSSPRVLRSTPAFVACQADDRQTETPSPLTDSDGVTETSDGSQFNTLATPAGLLSAPTTTTGPLCPGVPTTTPGNCPGRHDAYCAASLCFPGNPWLSCVCKVSGQICEAIDAFSLDPTTKRGAELLACIVAPPPSLSAPIPTRRKGSWFLATNRCIWGHWRAALEAIHDPTLPIPASLTPEWASAVSICRSKGIGGTDCCNAHVVAEQNAINLCGPYNSSDFGPSPTDVPGAPACSAIAGKLAPGPPFTGDFANVTDRISYGKSVCRC
jgi:Domain of unknown function (DUF4157)